MAGSSTKNARSRAKSTLEQSSNGQNPSLKRARQIAIFAFAFSGTAALIYEVVWTRELQLVFGSTVYAVSMMLASFMSGLSLGGFLGGKWADKSKNLIALFGLLELGIGVFGLLTIPLLQLMPTLYFFVFNTLKPGFYLFMVFQMLLSFIIMLIPTTFMGATFPVVTKINSDSMDDLGNDVGNVYSINTVGSIMGSLSAGFFLIPLIGLKLTTIVAASLNLIVAATMIALSRSAQGKKLLAVGASLLIVLGIVGVVMQEPAIAHNFYRLSDYTSYEDYQNYKEGIQTLFFRDDVHGRVTVFEVPSGERSLANDGKVEGSNTEYDKQAMSLFAFMPIEAAKDPKDVLVIGLGTGITADAAIKSSEANVDIAEINKAVLDASKFFIGDDIVNSPRSKFILNDARNYLLTSKKKYDVVTSEPSYPVSTHVSNLFTQEFYKLVKSHLKEGGVYCQWIPRYIMRDDDMLMMFKTYTSVFPNTYVWGSNYGPSQAQDVMMIGVNGDRKLDVKAINEAIRQAGAESMGLTNLDFSFYAMPEDIKKLVSGTRSDGKPIPINTDDKPLLEFITPKNHVDFFREGTKAFY